MDTGFLIFSYIDEGVGKVIIMLHGNPTWSFYYRNLVLLLKENYRIVVPDHIGCGLSDKPQDYQYLLKNHIKNIEILLKQLEIETFSLVMHDWGGAIGMGLARNHPNHVESLVIMNTAAFRSNKIPLRIQLCRIPVLGDLLVRGLNGFARNAVTMAVKNKMNRETMEGFLAPYDSWRNRIGILRFIQDIPLAPNHPSYDTLTDIENSLKQFSKTPIMLLWGGKDFCFTRHFYDQWLKRFPHAESKYFPQGGHYLLEDEYEAIGPLLKNFFKKNLGQPLS